MIHTSHEWTPIEDTERLLAAWFTAVAVGLLAPVVLFAGIGLGYLA